MLLQALTILCLTWGDTLSYFITFSVVLGLAKALVYPNFLAAIAESAHPRQRAQSIGIFRFCRDWGYALGALLTGLVADAFNIRIAILLVGAITLFSALMIQVRMEPVKRLRPVLNV